MKQTSTDVDHQSNASLSKPILITVACYCCWWMPDQGPLYFRPSLDMAKLLRLQHYVKNIIFKNYFMVPLYIDFKDYWNFLLTNLVDFSWLHLLLNFVKKRRLNFLFWNELHIKYQYCLNKRKTIDQGFQDIQTSVSPFRIPKDWLLENETKIYSNILLVKI